MAELQLYLRAFYQLILTAHFIGLALGLGGATITDYIFIKIIKSAKIDDRDLDLLKSLSAVIMVGIFMLCITGALLFFSDARKFSASGEFLAKLTMIFVLLINGLILNIKITPSLKGVFSIHFIQEFQNIRKVTFATGAISIVSWYTIFFLAMLKSYLSFTYFEFMYIYAVMVLSAIIVSQFEERAFCKKLKSLKSSQTSF